LQPQELRTLKILEAVEQEEAPSQRELARRLNVSLGLVNAFVKRLVNKGYFKVTTIPKNRVRYILTPKGAAEKTRLTYHYIQHSLVFYKEARQKLRNLFFEFEKNGVKKIAFYGTGDLAEIAYVSLQGLDISLVAVLDRDKDGEKFFGQTIRAVSDLPDTEFDKILLTVSKEADHVVSELVDQGIPSEKISRVG